MSVPNVQADQMLHDAADTLTETSSTAPQDPRHVWPSIHVTASEAQSVTVIIKTSFENAPNGKWICAPYSSINSAPETNPKQPDPHRQPLASTDDQTEQKDVPISGDQTFARDVGHFDMHKPFQIVEDPEFYHVGMIIQFGEPTGTACQETIFIVISKSEPGAAQCLGVCWSHQLPWSCREYAVPLRPGNSSPPALNTFNAIGVTLEVDNVTWKPAYVNIRDSHVLEVLNKREVRIIGSIDAISLNRLVQYHYQASVGFETC